MDLFSHASQDYLQSHAPLAEQLRPKKIDDFLGQEKVFGPHSPLRRLLEKGVLPSLILWGPPGSGKTTLANLLAQKVEATFISQNAIDLGAKVIRDLGQEARTRKSHQQRATVLFIDEIHRLNKSQQDFLLPFIEKGDFTLVGATTENPSYELNGALLSRCQLIVLSSHTLEDLKKLIERSFVHYNIDKNLALTDDAVIAMADLSHGDARALINLAEFVIQLYQNTPVGDETTKWPLTGENLEDLLRQQRPIYYDKKSDLHYDTISAFIKSIRGSDPDAGLYYLARMLKGGEDPRFIARRLIILASEDVGNADPRALQIAIAGLQAVEAVGLPEGAINLAQVVTYLASAPKSNRSYMGLRKAEEEVEHTGHLPIPMALRSGNNRLLKDLGYGKGYKYSHEGKKGWVEQEFFPEGVKAKKFYEPASVGFEKNISEFLKWLKNT